MAEGLDCGFYAVYLLESLSPRHAGHSYVGFTVCPERRLKQHNGELQHGARQTRKKRPWRMVCCLYGFPSKIVALQFEWAWQNPHKAKGVRTHPFTFGRHSIQHRIDVLWRLLQASPWDTMNLSLNLIDSGRFAQLLNHFRLRLEGRGEHFAVVAVADEEPTVLVRRGKVAERPPLPEQLKVVQGGFSLMNELARGLVDSDTDEGSSDNGMSSSSEETTRDRPKADSERCCFCQSRVAPDARLGCAKKRCSLAAHPCCLARYFYSSAPSDSQLVVPRHTAPCPLCDQPLDWAVVVQRAKEATRRRVAMETQQLKAAMQQTRKRARLEFLQMQQQQSQAN
eukprot:Sspe_Gene.84254::Locus_55298_Transcript_1_1_Confidence_1.000_Length_1395::g.84254::m.84254/K15078/SLX1; structure-specific endonuclease subunit SLX1